MATVHNVSNNSDESQSVQDLSETSERPLAYVETIKELQGIPGADIIEVATVLGWRVVVKKGLYKVGDPVVYVEIDSILPAWPYFINDKLDRCNFHVKTIKLRGQLSQGYCLPLHVLAEHPNKKVKLVQLGRGESVLEDLESNNTLRLCTGCDLTDFIGIRKHEQVNNINVAGLLTGPWPVFLRKTDQQRIQNLPQYPIEYGDVEFEVTEKLEGSSITAFYNKNEFGICSRNCQLKLDDNMDSVAARLLTNMGVKDALYKLGKNLAIQGELLGPGIQCNVYKLQTHVWKIFDVYMIDEGRYMLPHERKEVLSMLKLSKDTVPMLQSMKIGGMSVDDILKLAEGVSLLYKTQREGIVFKSSHLVDGNTISFKAISNIFELKKT